MSTRYSLFHAYLHRDFTDIAADFTLYSCYRVSLRQKKTDLRQDLRTGCWKWRGWVRVLCQPNQWKLLLISDPGQRNEQTNRERGRVTKFYVGPPTRD